MVITRFWGFVIGLGVWAIFDDMLMRINNSLNGRDPEDPKGNVGCMFYVWAVVILYLLALFL